MPLTGSALKRHKIAMRNRDRKRPLRSEVRTRIKTARVTMAEGDFATAEQKLREALVRLDRAATRGAIHRRNAARRKSRLQIAFNRTFAERSATN
jgi:small subunit ribosomal protein S20